MEEAVFALIQRLNAGLSHPDEPITGKSQPKTERNNEVKRLYSIGWKVPEIAHWESRTFDTEKLGLEFALCIEAVDKIHRLWTISSDEDRQGLVRNLFSSVTYDLDRRCITDFRLKPWADRFIVLRAALYEHEDKQKETADGSLGMGKAMLHTGLWLSSAHDVDAAVIRFLHMLYADQQETTFPINNKTPKESSRNVEIIAAYEVGTSLGELAERYGITKQRVHQIVNRRRK